MKTNKGNYYEFDICVLGAGPAGTSAALELLKLGFKVCILEKVEFPRSHVGICFSQSIFTIANFLGIEEAVSKSILWERKSILLKWQQQLKEVEQPGIHVDRGILDFELLNLIRSKGATVYQPISQLSCIENDHDWTVKFKCENKPIQIRAKFIVDATGRGGTINKTKLIKYQPNLLAIHATWKVRNQSSSDGYMEALPEAWSWGAYLGNNNVLLSVYTDATILKANNTTIENYYLDKIQQIESLQGIQLEALISKIEVCDASSHFDKNVVGDKYIKIGDAAFTVDPLSSQGVFIAISSAFCVSRVVRTILDATKDTKLAKEFYQSFIKDRVNSFKERIPLEYQKVSAFSESPFWKERSKSDAQPTLKEEKPLDKIDLSQPYMLKPEAKIVTVPILGNDFIESSKAISLLNKRPIAFVNGVSVIDFLETYKMNDEGYFDFSREKRREKMEILKHLAAIEIIEYK